MTDKTDRRQRILEKASDQFFALGYTRVTMDELAKELGMSKKTLYKYFPSKVDMLRAIVQDFIREVIEEQDRILNDKKLDFEQRLSELLKLLVRLLSKIDPSLMRDVQRAAPDVWETIEQTRQNRINTVFGGLLREGQQNGYVRRDIHLPLVIMAMAATIRATLNPATVSQFPVSLIDAFETVRSLYLGGILTDQGRQKFIAGIGFSDGEMASKQHNNHC